MGRLVLYVFSSLSLFYFLLWVTRRTSIRKAGLFSSGFLTEILYKFLICLIRATCPAHLILELWLRNTTYSL
jgi:hypothetical protein